MAAFRKTPTTTNGGSGSGTPYTAAVDVEIEALWKLAPQWLTSVAGTNTITAASDGSLVGSIAGYSRPNAFYLVPAVTNTSGTVTINIDAQGATAIVDRAGNALVAGALVAGTVYFIIFDGTSFRLFSTGLPAIMSTPAPDVILQEQQAQNTSAGTFTAVTWTTRALNTQVRNVAAGATFTAGSNSIALPAGTWCAEWSAPADQVGGHQTRLWNITDSTAIAYGVTQYSPTNATTNNRSAGKAVFTLSVSKSVRLEHSCQTTVATNGLGVPANQNTEIYATMELFRIS